MNYAYKEDHPRVCGEKTFVLEIKSYRVGSPPRMRGKGKIDGLLIALLGITPAYAGKRGGVAPCYTKSWDHPRVCGEKDQFVNDCVRLLGSPPRMRGKAARVFVFPVTMGITPAYAGKRLNKSLKIVIHSLKSLKFV